MKRSSNWPPMALSCALWLLIVLLGLWLSLLALGWVLAQFPVRSSPWG